MLELINLSPVAVRVRANRTRNTMRRKFDVIRRCDLLPQSDIDDETFPELLDEIVSDLGVGKDEVADALDVNLATLYRWLKRKNLPLAFARPKLLGTLADLLRADIDKSVARLLDDRRASNLDAPFGISEDGVHLLDSVASSGLSVADQAVLCPIEGPYGETTHGKKRPTFAAFAWRGVGTFELTPASVIAEAYVSVTIPGMSYFCHDTEQFIPIDVSDGIGQLLVFTATDVRNPAMPPIILRSSENATAFGTLVLTSSTGVPYDVRDTARSKQVYLYPLKSGSHVAPPQARTLTIAIPRDAGNVVGMDNLLRFTPVHTSSGPSSYDHSRALELNNFQVFHDRRQHSTSAASGGNQFTGVAARVVVFSESSERSSRFATHICTHDGAELIVPLYGSVDAHLIDTEGEFFDADRWGDRKEFLLGEVIGDGDPYEPLILSGTTTANDHLPGMLALNPNRILHGFTSLSRKAALLVFTVRKLSKRDGWTARSLVDCAPADSKIVNL